MKKFFSYTKEKAKLIAKDSEITNNERELYVDYKVLCEELEDRIIQLEKQLNNNNPYIINYTGSQTLIMPSNSFRIVGE